MSLVHKVNMILEVSGSQSVVPGSAASASLWELVRNANTGVPAQTYSVRHCRGGLQRSVF